MAFIKNYQEMRIAIFGDSGSGKTTFLASYYGNQQQHFFEKEKGYRLICEDASKGNELLAHYYRMEEGNFPLGTEKFQEFNFEFRVSGLSNSALRITWFDYPGGWWSQTVHQGAQKTRVESLSKLLTSHVGILLIDGMKYSKKDGASYLKKQLDTFKNTIREIKDELINNGTPIDAKLPKQWVIAISKADMLPNSTTAESIAKSMLKEADEQFKGVADAIGEGSQFGNIFLLLSSVKGSSNLTGKIENAHIYMGLELIAPLVLEAILRDIRQTIQPEKKDKIMQRVLELFSGVVDVIDKLDDFLPEKYQALTQILNAIHLRDDIDKGVEYFKQKQQKQIEKGNALEATIASLHKELSSEESKKLYFMTQ